MENKSSMVTVIEKIYAKSYEHHNNTTIESRWYSIQFNTLPRQSNQNLLIFYRILANKKSTN